jgi:hypothetical protein
VRLNSSGLLIRDCCGSTTPPAMPRSDPPGNRPPRGEAAARDPGGVPPGRYCGPRRRWPKATEQGEPSRPRL